MRIWGTGLLKGMSITFKNMLRGPITVQYPHEKIELPERARWAVKPKFDEAGNPKCTACMSCVRACPDFILDLQSTAGEDRSKHIDHFRYEVGACMMCGLCVEACPFDAIEMSHEYELARGNPSELGRDLLTDVDAAGPTRERPAGPGSGPARPKPERTAAAAGPGEETPATGEASAAPPAGGEPAGE